MPSPGAALSPVFTILKLSEHHPFGFLWRLYDMVMVKSLAFGTWFNVQPLSPPQRSEGQDWKFLLSQGWFSWPPAPIFRGRSKSHLANITKKHLYCSHYLGNSKGFGSSVPETGTEIKYKFLINYNITVHNYKILNMTVSYRVHSAVRSRVLYPMWLINSEVTDYLTS